MTTSTLKNGWLAYYSYKRIEAPGYQPCPLDGAAARLRFTLGLTSRVPLGTDDTSDLVKRGRRLAKQHMPIEAVVLFERATQLDPTNADAWCGLGIALYIACHYKEALIALERATKLAPTNAEAWEYRGESLYGLRRKEEALAAYEEALAIYDHAVALDPSDAAAWDRKATTLRNMGRTAEADAALKIAQELYTQQLFGQGYRTDDPLPPAPLP